MTPSDAGTPPAGLARPPALRAGDRVAVLSVSSPAPADQLEMGLDVLRFAGLDPVLYPSARDRGTVRRYLAGDDQMRAADLRAALTDPTIAGIIFAIGGSGAQRTLEAMDWDGIAGLPPKVLAGYSDVTAVLEAVASKLGWASLLSPNLVLSGPASHYSFGSMLRALMHPERSTEICYPMATRLVSGTASGVTLGGNLTLLTSSLGTGTSRPARGGILLVEEKNEAEYRLDRMLTQLRRSGYTDGVAGIVAGTFTGCGEPAAIEEILAERLGGLGVPMIAWANVGHGGYFQTFPIGIAAELDADAATLRLLDPPLRPAVDLSGPRLHQPATVSRSGVCGSSSRAASTGVCAWMMRRPWARSRGEFTASSATSRSPASQHTDHWRAAGSPRSSIRSAAPWKPMYWTIRPNCSDQKYGTGS
jgi:muramoyltetrapeptide carboxypeptidase